MNNHLRGVHIIKMLPLYLYQPTEKVLSVAAPVAPASSIFSNPGFPWKEIKSQSGNQTRCGDECGRRSRSSLTCPADRQGETSARNIVRVKRLLLLQLFPHFFLSVFENSSCVGPLSSKACLQT
jgi:hypothetical protein